MNLIIKVVFALLFFLCLLDMPYGYYQLVRFAGLVGFVLLAYNSYTVGRSFEVIIYVCLALLFQPFVKVALGRTIWNLVDIVVGAGLIVSIFAGPKEANTEHPK